MKPGMAFHALCFAPLHFVVLSLVLVSCGLEPRSRLLPNQPPTVTLHRPTPLAVGETQGISLAWRGDDPDGRVDHYVFATDPRSVDRVDQTWIRTQDHSTRLGSQRRASTGRLVAAGKGVHEEPRVFAVRAVDDMGAMSEPATIAFFGANIAPSVIIESPQPNPISLITPTSLEIRWRGTDEDGRITKYKYRLFGQRNPDFPGIDDFIAFVLSCPDCFRQMYAPSFSSWDSVGPDTQSVRYSGLTPGQPYLFAVTAFDDAGDYTPVFSPNTNLLRFAVAPVSGNPVLCVASPLFNYCASGDRDLAYEIPAVTAFPVTWSATPSIGSSIEAYRWVLDPLDPADEKRRTHPTADPNHWTPWNLETTTATIGPFSPRESRSEHVFYLQARDNFDRISTLRIRLTPVRATQAREILVVDDTRLQLDQTLPGGGLAPPRGEWPTAAELDTFLYARGGFPWRGYPPGTLSPPGLLAGYDFDTLGTRGLPGGIVPLSVLGQYRHVIWMTDPVGATFNGFPTDPYTPMTSLRLMNSLGGSNTLGAYMAQGGRVWLFGGGAAYASLIPWNKLGTDARIYSFTDGELVPGRMMYDFAKWQSEIQIRPASQAQRRGGIPGERSSISRGWSGAPDYSRLPSVLAPRSPATDPAPPLRFNDSFYYIKFYTAEYLSRPNFIREDVDPRPNHEQLESTLDTLYITAGGTAQIGRPVMTYYHGSEGGSVVFSGFAPWFFRRSQCAALVDFVLQDIWGLARQSTVVASRRQ